MPPRKSRRSGQQPKGPETLPPPAGPASTSSEDQLDVALEGCPHVWGVRELSVVGMPVGNALVAFCLFGQAKPEASQNLPKRPTQPQPEADSCPEPDRWREPKRQRGRSLQRNTLTDRRLPPRVHPIRGSLGRTAGEACLLSMLADNRTQRCSQQCHRERSGLEAASTSPDRLRAAGSTAHDIIWTRLQQPTQVAARPTSRS